MKHAKLLLIGASFLLASFFAFAGLAGAQSFRSGDTATVANDETVDGMLFSAGNTVDIAGVVNGDVYCAGQNVTISGEVNGDIICAGQTVTISGTINGSLRVAGQTVTLGGEVDGSATIATQSFIVESGGKIERDILGVSDTITINGEIGRDMVAGATNLIINEKIGRNVNGEVTNLSVTDGAVVGGTVEYTSANDATIADGAEIQGEVIKKTPAKSSTPSYTPVGVGFAMFIYLFIAMLLVLLALALLIPKVLHSASDIALKKPGKTVVAGLLAAIVVPLGIIALLVSVIGIPLGILALLTWIVVVMLSGPFAGYLLGRLVLKKSKSPILIALLGGSLLLVLYFIPIVGFIAMLFAYLFGVGMIILDAGQRLPKPSQNLSAK